MDLSLIIKAGEKAEMVINLGEEFAIEFDRTNPELVENLLKSCKEFIEKINEAIYGE